MTTRSLAAHASLHSLKKQAKTLLKAGLSGDAFAAQRIAPYFANISEVGLQDVQLVIAREYGFSSWSKLKAHIETGSSAEPRDRLANRFLALACVSYFGNIPADPARFVQAADLFANNPDIAGESIHVAAARGDADRVAAWLDRQPQLLERRGGPFDWPPLLYAAYARVPGSSSLPAARVLLSRGADPNAFFLDHGQYRFTALTGVFGEGEAGKIRQPEHPDIITFARLLLEAGAIANDSQALYNRMFEPDDTCLTLLLEHGLTANDRNNWLVRSDGGLVENSQTVFDYQLAWALEKRMPSRVRLLVEHGADVNRPVCGRTPYEWARLGGDTELAAYLVHKGAVAVRLQPEDWVYTRIFDNAYDIEQLGRMARELTGIEAVQRKHPAALHEAAGADERKIVRRMLSLGFDVNAMTSRTPLHEAALHGHLEMARLLIANGADTLARDPSFYAPPIGWADYNGKTEMVEFLKTQLMDVFAAAAFGAVDQLTRCIEEVPSRLDIRFGDFRPKGRAIADRDWMTPLGMAIVNGRTEAVAFLLARGADRGVRDASGRSYLDLAREGGNPVILSLLRPQTADPA